LVRKPKGKRSLGRPRRRRKNIKMNPEGIIQESVWNGSGSGYGPVAGSCEHGNETSVSIKGWEFLVQLIGC